MKQLFTLVTLTLYCLSYAQKEVKVDTTTFRIGDNTVIFINTAPDSIKYDYNFNHSDSSCSKEKDTEWPKFYIDVATNGYLSANRNLDLPNSQEELNLNYGRSRSFGFNFQFKGFESKNKRWYISPGLGMTWNGYHFDNNIAINNNNELTTFSLDTLRDNTKYKFRVTYLEVPLIVGVKLGKGKNPLQIQAGIIAGLRTGSIIKQKFKESGLDHTVKIRDDFNLSPFKVDYIARLSIGDIGIFARYSTTTLFKENKGPVLYPFAIGISFGDF